MVHFPSLYLIILRGPRRPSSILKFGRDSGLVYRWHVLLGENSGIPRSELSLAGLGSILDVWTKKVCIISMEETSCIGLLIEIDR